MTTTRIPCIGGPLDGQQTDDYMLTFGAIVTGGCRYSREEFQGMRFFVADTMGFLAARREMRRIVGENAYKHGFYANDEAMADIFVSATSLVDCARALGVVLTITQRPLTPLGMAHYETVVEVRPVQVPT